MKGPAAGRLELVLDLLGLNLGYHFALGHRVAWRLGPLGKHALSHDHTQLRHYDGDGHLRLLFQNG